MPGAKENQNSNLDALLKSAFWIAGPTASGKSQLALQLAEKIDGEIISVDSMQVYRGMDIGTAKASIEERLCIPHHMIDVVEIHQAYDAARFRKEALLEAEKIKQRGRNIIFCGGTGLYFQALIHGVGKGPPSDPKIRQDLEIMPIEDLVKELKEKDTLTAKRIDLHNKRRLVRALEVVRLTGKSFVSFKSDWKNSGAIDAARFWVLEHSVETLRKRIDDRVERMVQAGWIQETQRLVDMGLNENSTASQAIGYRQIIEYLEGKTSRDTLVQLIKTKTWQYAKRQRTWFRHQIKNRPINMEADRPENLLNDLLKS
jgi:tRNA dimethylallyltransferase